MRGGVRTLGAECMLARLDFGYEGAGRRSEGATHNRNERLRLPAGTVGPVRMGTEPGAKNQPASPVTSSPSTRTPNTRISAAESAAVNLPRPALTVADRAARQ